MFIKQAMTPSIAAAGMLVTDIYTPVRVTRDALFHINMLQTLTNYVPRPIFRHWFSIFICFISGKISIENNLLDKSKSRIGFTIIAWGKHSDFSLQHWFSGPDNYIVTSLWILLHVRRIFLFLEHSMFYDVYANIKWLFF